MSVNKYGRLRANFDKKFTLTIHTRFKFIVSVEVINEALYIILNLTSKTTKQFNY